MPEPVIRLAGVRKAFGDLVVLDGLDLAVAKGERLAIIGGSGTGKSVLLKIMIGLLAPDAGVAAFDGRDWATLRPEEAARLRTRFGFVFQGGALFDSLSVGENVAFPLRENGVRDEARIRAVVAERLAEVGLEGVQAKMPAELSGGMRKRVALARALVLEPEVVLYDEPTTGLDPVNSRRINDLILETAAGHRVTSVVVTHDMTSALAVATRIAMVGDGRLLFDGDGAQFTTSAIPEVRDFISYATAACR